MSLLDALLLDPAPFHIWVAVRSDLQRGSGTVSDPFHGGMVAGLSQFDTIMTMAPKSGWGIGGHGVSFGAMA